MAGKLVHTCIRVRDENAGIAFYERLGFEVRGRLNSEDGYRVELIGGGEFPTPQDPPHPDSVAAG